MSKGVRFITSSAMIAAMYVVLTLIAGAMGLASGTIQFRLSEALCILPAFNPAAIPGLAIGCIIANMVSGCIVVDTVFGSLATLLAALCTFFIGRAFRVGKTEKLRIGAVILAPLPAVLFNAAIIPFVLYYGYQVRDVFGITGAAPVIIGLSVLTVGIGELVICYVLGVPLMYAVNRIGKKVKIF